MEVARLTAVLGLKISEFEQNLQRASQKAEVMGRKMQDVGKKMSIAITAPLMLMGTLAVRAFDKQAQAEGRLRAALEANGRAVTPLLAEYKKFASHLQDITTIGDEASLEMIQVAESMGLTGDSAERATKNAIGMAAAFGMSAASAIRYTAALESGDTTMLNRYIPTLRMIKDDTERAAEAQRLLGNMFKVAQSEAKNGLGPLKQLQNSIGDLMEQFGKIIAEAINPFIARLKSITKKFQELPEHTKKVIVAIAGIAAALGPLLIGLGTLVKLLPLIVGSFVELGAFFLANPIGLTITGIAIAVGLLIKKLGDGDLFTGLQKMADSFKNIFSAINDTITGIKNFIAAIDTMIKAVTFSTSTIDKMFAAKAKAEAARANQYKGASKIFGTTQNLLPNVFGTQQQVPLKPFRVVENQPKNQTGGAGGTGEIVNPAEIEKLKSLTDNTRIATDALENMHHSMTGIASDNGLTQAFQRSEETIRRFSETVSSILVSAMEDAAASIGHLMGSLAAGMKVPENLGLNVLNFLGKLLQQLGAAVVAFSGIGQALQIAIGTNPALAAALGVAAIAAGAAISGYAQAKMAQTPSLSGGSSTSVGSIGGVNTQPSFGNVTFTIKGEDLWGWFNNYNKSGRYG